MDGRAVAGVMAAGALGAAARYLLDGYVSQRAPGIFPWGTFVINVSGSFLLGLLITAMTERLTVATWLRASVTIGLIGSYTTFSTLSLESFRLAEDGSWLLAATNSVGSLAAGLVAVYAGVVVGRLI